MQDEQLSAVRTSKPKRLPTMLSKYEALAVIGYLQGTNNLNTQIMYGSGLWIIETLRLRVKALDDDNPHTLYLIAQSELKTKTALHHL